MGTIDEPTCLRCQTRMEIGFLVDRGDMVNLETTWVQGLPDKKWTGSLAVEDRLCLPTRTFRCPRCGYLESYVPRAAERAG